jgi:hypothetical protein
MRTLRKIAALWACVIVLFLPAIGCTAHLSQGKADAIKAQAHADMLAGKITPAEETTIDGAVDAATGGQLGDKLFNWASLAVEVGSALVLGVPLSIGAVRRLGVPSAAQADTLHPDAAEAIVQTAVNAVRAGAQAAPVAPGAVSG